MGIKNTIEKICNFARGVIRVAGTLVGVKWKGRWTYDSLVLSCWTFVIGLPIGVLILGSSFSLLLWFSIILSLLFIVNIDDALLQMSNYLTYGVDGEVAPYEKVS